MRRARSAVAISILAAADVAAGPPMPRGAVLVDRVVAVVGGQVVTQSDLWLEARVAARLANLDDPALNNATLRASLTWVVGRLLLSEEAKRLQVFKVPENELDGEKARFRGRFADEAAYRAFLAEMEVDDAEIAAILRRDLRVQRYLDSRVKIAAQVRDSEVDVFYRERKKQFANQPLSEIREVVRAYLYKQKYEKLVSELVADLRKRGDVEVVVDFKGEG